MKTYSRSKCRRVGVVFWAAWITAAWLNGQEPKTAAATPEVVIQQLLEKLAAHEARIEELEKRLAAREAPATPAAAAAPAPAPNMLTAADSQAGGAPGGMFSEPVPSVDSGPHDHMINLPGGGPTLKFRGFTDINFDVGQNANPLQYPLGATAHNTFQLGEFDLFMSSKLSEHFSFIGELVIGADQTNYWGLDLERVELTYKANKYFEVSAGRFHSAIGYYNTTFHHGTWFQTATGRPFMYFFEDSGGLLPVHNVGMTATGLVPGTGRLNLHWVAEWGNGRTSSLDPAAQPVQNFLSDRNHKSYNFAAYIKPQWLEGLQVGGSYYRDKLFPDGVTGVNQTIASVYAVYNNSNWELLNEGVLMRNASDFDHRVYNTPLMYSQISRRFGLYRPYVRYQYINASGGDPINVFHGLYQGPSVGLRYDVTAYAALKFQYNRLYQTGTTALNGFNGQVAFTF